MAIGFDLAFTYFEYYIFMLRKIFKKSLKKIKYRATQTPLKTVINFLTLAI